jgi:lysine decarboxylase
MHYDTPLFDALINYSRQQKVPFHMPGHKQGQGIPDQFKKHIFDIDLTELPETDNLHAPEGPVQKAQELAATAFGAKYSFFLVNGSTCGIQAMVATVCNPGDMLLVDRNCHSSVIYSLILCGVIPRYIYPDYITELGLVGGMDPRKVDEAFIQYPEAKGILITCPTYYGVCSDLEIIAQIAHRYGKILLVDEAHGAHFCFHERLPQGALQAGADICVQSVHKTLPALTQSSLLHVNSDRIELNRLKNCLKLFQSSSPSFVLMAYLDVARGIMQNSGQALLSNLIDWVDRLRCQINRNNKLYCLGKELIGKYHIKDIDLTRIVINTGKLGLTGYRAAMELNIRYNIQVEMADLSNVVCITSVADSEKQLKYLGKAINGIAPTAVEKDIKTIFAAPCISRYAMAPTKAFYTESESVHIEKSEGRVCCDTITSFPPGIPILCPGEVISGDIVKYMLNIKACGGKVIGLTDELYIRVVKN